MGVWGSSICGGLGIVLYMGVWGSSVCGGLGAADCCVLLSWLRV